MTLRTDPQFQDALNFLKTREGGSIQQIVRTAIIERAERLGHRDRVAGAARDVKDQWGEALGRLGKV
jgi:hypothetical protein